MSPAASASEWDAFLAPHSEAHLLQSPAWAEFKSEFGWRAGRVVSGNSGAQVLFRPLASGHSLAYLPKGPVGPWSAGLLADLDALCRRQRAFLLTVEPDGEDSADLGSEIARLGLRPSPRSIQPRRTLVIDLLRSEEVLLQAMHPKTRYNIGLAARRDVSVRPWSDLDAFGRMVRATAVRQDFGAHTDRYYRRAYEVFYPRGECELFLAEHAGHPLAALMVFARGNRSWYFYGASTEQERARMPTYLLQWQAIRWARGRGCREYDLWGVPDADLPQLEAQFSSRSDGLWGVYRFKRGFGGRLLRTPGGWDRPYSRLLYSLYRFVNRRIEA